MITVFIASTTFVVGFALGSSGMLTWIKAQLPWSPKR